ncbi:MAG: hypothetical protein ACPGYT_09605 [Nitrospirales bacterium]
MDMQISVTPNSSDLLLWVGFGLIILSLLYLKILNVRAKTRTAFSALQPNLQISRSATVYSHGEDTLTISLRNRGGSPAVDIRVTVHGGEGVEPSPIIPVIQPEDSEHEVWVKAKLSSPLLQEKRDTIQLIIRYRDRWGYSYGLMHPVVQRESIHGWVALQLVERVKSRVSKPPISFWRMRMILLLQSRAIQVEGHEGEVRSDSRYVEGERSVRQLQPRAYLAKVWQVQDKKCRTIDARKFNSRVSPFSAT